METIIMNNPLFTITEIDFQPIRPNLGLIGFVSFVLNNSLRISGISVYTRLDGTGIRLVYPERILKYGAKVSLICPITSSCGTLFTNAVTEYIDRLINKKLNSPEWTPTT